jgi:hypothetical protein
MKRYLTWLALIAPAVNATAMHAQIPSFTDRTSAAGVTFTHLTGVPDIGEAEMMTPGVGVADFNRDGWLDLFVQGGLGQNSALFINNCDGTFVDQATDWGIDLTGVEGSSVTIGDVDGNGYPDVYTGVLNGRNHLLLNTGHGGFIENAVDAGVDLQVNTFGATLGDIELDGDLDLYTAMWSQFSEDGCRLFVNDGTGVFVDTTEGAGLLMQRPGDCFAFSPALVDLDGDRFPELVVAADFGTSRYFVNNTDGTFTALSDNGTCTDENGMGSAIADFDNDGDLDWFVTSIFDDDGHAEANWGITGNRLYRNEGGHRYTDVTDLTGVRNGDWGWGASFADLNHDGFLDLVMTNGFAYPNGGDPDPTFVNDPARVWISDGVANEPAFTEVAARAGVTHTAAGKGLVTFDYDHDGDLDIVMTTNLGDLVLYRNNTNPPRSSWVELDLVAPPGNAPDGFGAVVTVRVGPDTLTRVVHGGMTFMSQEPPRLHFGFRSVATIDEIRIRWPDATVTVLWNVVPGQLLIVNNGDLSGDNVVGPEDLFIVLESWGRCPPQALCIADLNRDGHVGIVDLLTVLANWHISTLLPLMPNAQSLFLSPPSERPPRSSPAP